jgi:DNA-binding FadR family transcriptional regulator
VTSRVSEIVHDRLRADIVNGKLAPGDAVPSERMLSEQFGVNRHAVREALKRLQQAGLISISQGGATRVRDWERTGGLDLLFDLPGIQPDESIIRGILEMRASIGADAARRAALRSTEEQRARVVELADGSEENYEALWLEIVDASANLAYKLALNTLIAGVAEFPDVQARMLPRPGVPELGAAIAAGDADRAEQLARDLLEP